MTLPAPAISTEPQSPPLPAPRRVLLAVIAVLAFATPLVYAAYTGHTWEDYFITFRHSANLAHGHGLVYQVGERVHGFTSPLGTLLPAVFYAATGAGDYLPALWLFRLASAVAFAGGIVVLGRLLISRDPAPRAWPVALLAMLYVLDAKSVAFSANGQESAFVLLFLAWALHATFARDTIHWRHLGLAAAGLQWTRPDGCVHIALLGAAALLLSRTRRSTAVALLKAAALCTVLYLPWFLFACAYYGSPVPNTIRAKMIFTEAYLRQPGVAQRVAVIARAFWDQSVNVFLPVYAGPNDWPPFLAFTARVAALVGMVYWLVPVRDRVGRAASLMYTGACVYFAMTAMFPWYAPPATMLGLLAFTCAGATLVARAPRSRVLRVTVGTLAAAVVIHQAVVFAGTWRQMRIQQAEIETNGRKQIGLWLRERVGPGDRVYLESLGYIGYFSNARMYDYPGLVAPEVVRLRRTEGLNMYELPAALHPEWIVARPFEVDQMRRAASGFDDYYQLAHTFDARPRLAAYGPFWGSSYVNYDSQFYVLHRMK